MKKKFRCVLLVGLFVVEFPFQCLPQSGPGKALSFDGVNDSLIIGGSSVSTPWTAEVWVKRQDSPSWSSVLLVDASSALKLEQFNFTRKVGFTKFGVADYAFNYTAPTNVWVHLAFVGTSNKTQLYVNGSLQDEIAASISLPLGQIGTDTSGDLLKGIIDDLRIWNSARSQSQIQSNMNSALFMPQTNLVAYWRFDEGTGTQTFDSTGNGHTGTLTNGVTWVTGNVPYLGPQLTVPTNQTTTELASVSVTASAADVDFPTNALTFGLVNPPVGMSINPTNGVISWVPLGTQGGQAYPIRVVVTENSVPPVSVSNSFTVVVNDVNKAPVLTVPSNATKDNGSSITLEASADDVDVPIQTLTYTLLSGPVGMSINSASGVIKWTPAGNQYPSSNIVTIVVSDNGSPVLRATNSFVLLVRSNAPILATSNAKTNTVTITWNSATGRTYQVQGASSLLGLTNWVTLSAVTATNVNSNIKYSLNSPYRYFRIESVP